MISCGLQHPWEGKHYIAVLQLGNPIAPMSETVTQRFHSMFSVFIRELPRVCCKDVERPAIGPSKAACSLIF